MRPPRVRWAGGLPDGPEQRPFVYAGSVFIYSGGGLFKSYPGQGQKGPGDSVSDHGNASGSAGAAIYRSVYYFLQNDSALATKNLLETIQIAGAIAMGIFTMDSLFRLVLAYDRKKAEKG